MKYFYVLGTLLISTGAFARGYLECKIYRGYFVNRQLIEIWNSDMPKPFPKKYYGKFEDNQLYMIWGINIGPDATGNSEKRFQILATPKNGRRTITSVSSLNTIDVAAYIGDTDISIECMEN